MRGVFWAPMSEVGMPARITGSAFGIGCLIGYAPGMFAYMVYGSILDANPEPAVTTSCSSCSRCSPSWERPCPAGSCEPPGPDGLRPRSKLLADDGGASRRRPLPFW